MASPQSQALGDLFDQWREIFATAPEIDEIRGLFESWHALTEEPDAVEYEQVDCDGVKAIRATPRGAASNRVMLAVHGGGYIGGSMHSHRKMFGHIAKAAGCLALIPDYRLAPEHIFPAALDDVLTSYRWLLAQGFAPGRIAIVGDSAGGALSLGLQLRLRELGLQRPAATALLSAFTDLTGQGESMASNAGRDRIVSSHTIDATCAAYLGEADRRDPLASPVFADFTGLAPIYLQVGGDECLLDDSRRVADAACAAGVEVQIDVFPDMQHVFQIMAGKAPEANDAVARIGAWLRGKFDP